jgi:hypothetical protein
MVNFRTRGVIVVFRYTRSISISDSPHKSIKRWERHTEFNRFKLNACKSVRMFVKSDKEIVTMQRNADVDIFFSTCTRV